MSPGHPAAPDPTEDAFLKGLRRRRRIAIASGLLALSAAGAVAAWWLTRPPPRCDAEQAEHFLHDSSLPIGALSRVCDLPAPLATALSGALAAPPGMADLLGTQVVVDAPELVITQCPDLPGALAGSAQVAPAEGAALLASACDWQEMGLSESDVLRSSRGRVALAVAVHTALKDTDGALASPMARRVLDGR